MDDIIFKFLDGPKVEIRGNSQNRYQVAFIDNDTNETIHTDNILCNSYTRCFREWYTNWKIVITHQDQVIKEYVYKIEGIVVITFESSALGDTIAWIPYVEEFRKKHNCQVLCSTFHNDLFISEYPEIKFMQRGTTVPGIQSVYRIGWFGKGEASNKNKSDCRLLPLQKLAADILGLDYIEIVPKIKKDLRDRLVPQKYVALTTVSTAQAKFWNNPTGWQEVTNYLLQQGFIVVNIGRNPNNLTGVVNMTGNRHMNDIINIIQHCEFFIGLSSGLNWMSWGLNKPNIMIAGFTMEFNEYSNPHRIINKSGCHGCWNWGGETFFNKGDWNWCPKNKGTLQHFECSKNIASVTVIEHINQIIDEQQLRG